jgi:PAS domain S-box-containing protein
MSEPATPSAVDDSELERLRASLAHAEEALRAIRSGEVDALVVPASEGGPLFARSGAERTYRILIEGLYQGVATLSRDGVVLYGNRRLAELLGIGLHQVIGQRLADYLEPASLALLDRLIARARAHRSSGEVVVRRPDGSRTPLLFALSALPGDLDGDLGLVATDLSDRNRAAEEKQRADALAEANRELDAFNRLMIGRELAMIELKRQVNDLSRELGRERPYPLAFDELPNAESDP